MEVSKQYLPQLKEYDILFENSNRYDEDGCFDPTNFALSYPKYQHYQKVVETHFSDGGSCFLLVCRDSWGYSYFPGWSWPPRKHGDPAHGEEGSAGGVWDHPHDHQHQ